MELELMDLQFKKEIERLVDVGYIRNQQVVDMILALHTGYLREMRAKRQLVAELVRRS